MSYPVHVARTETPIQRASRETANIAIPLGLAIGVLIGACLRHWFAWGDVAFAAGAFLAICGARLWRAGTTR